MGLLEPMQKDPLRTRARAEGGLKALRARAEVDSGRIGAIGFCFGGTVALDLARSGADVRGVVGFHSGLATARPTDARNIKGKVLDRKSVVEGKSGSVRVDLGGGRII